MQTKPSPEVLKPETALNAILVRAVSQLREILELLKVDTASLSLQDFIALKTARVMLKELLNVLERLCETPPRP